LTAAHVVGTKEVGQQVTVQWAPPGQQPQRFTAIIPHKKPEWDIALLEIQSEGKTFPWLMLGDSDPQHLRLGDEVTIAGFPKPETLGCTTPTLTKGQLTAERKKLEELDPELEVLQLNIPPGIHPGSSGSPVLDATDKVIGILIRGVVELSVYFAVPINIAAETDALKLHEVLPPYPPQITFIDFPNKIIGDGQPYKGRVGFRDPNRDLIKARFQVRGSGGE
jgi:S1-C subfamily serine protease